MRCRPCSSWHLFLLLHAPKHFQRMNTLDTIIEEPNEANTQTAQNKSEHRCEASKCTQLIESEAKSEAKTFIESSITGNEKVVHEEEEEEGEGDTSSEQREKSRKQWETSPDQMKEISRSLEKINGSHLDKRDHQLIRSKRSTKEKLNENQANRSTLPPLNSLSDSDSGKEVNDLCICEKMYKSSGDLNTMEGNTESNQWVVSRPIRNKPKDNLRLEGMMEMETTFKNSYETTSKQMNEIQSQNVAVVLPSNKLSSEETNFERMKRIKANDLNAIKASKKKAKHRPSTSLKAGGDGYFNTINKESYKNFVIIDDKSKAQKTINGSNGKKTSVCCSTLDNIKLPKVDSNHKEDYINRRRSRDDKSDFEQINKSMQRLTTDDRYEGKYGSHMTQTNGNFGSFVDSSVQTNYDFYKTNGIQEMSQKSNEKIDLNVHQREGSSQHQMAAAFDPRLDPSVSWTVGSLEDHHRIYTRDVDNIKELGLMDRSNQMTGKEVQSFNEKEKIIKTSNELKIEATDRSRGTTRVRYESKNYVEPQTRLKKHKNESSMKLFDGDMDFMTTTKSNYADKSPNRADPKRPERERTAGKKSRKSGRKRNLFRTSTEAEFYEPYGEKTIETTYQKQFGDRLYCPAIDLGSNKSDFKYRGEASGHKFFLPAVNN